MDKELEQIRDAVRELKPPHMPDVTDAVMQRVATLPQPMAPLHDSRRRNFARVAGVAAACIAGVVLVTLSISHNGLQASNPNSASLSTRFTDVYEYCNFYADEEMVEEAAYYDNPVSLLM